MSYPNYPAPGQHQPPPPVAKAPGTVTLAFLIYLLAAAVALVSVVLTLTNDTWDTIIRNEAGKVRSDGITAEDLVNTTKTILIVIGVVLLALYLLFAFKMRAGRNWARIVLTVLSALSILTPFSATGRIEIDGTVYEATSTQAVGYVGAAISVVAIVLMYLAPSNAYFKARKMEKARGILGV